MSKKKRTGLEFDTAPILNFYKKIVDGLLWKFFNFGRQILLVFVGIAYVAKKVFFECLKRLYPSVMYWCNVVVRFALLVENVVVTPIVLLIKCFAFVGRTIKNAKGFRKFTAVFTESAAVIRKNPKPLFTLLNHVVPIAAVACMIFVIISTATTTYAVEITCDDKFVGIVKDEKVFQSANTMLLQRVVETGQKVELTPSFRLVRTMPGDILDTVELTDELIKSTNIEIEEACGLYIDGVFIKATPKKETLDQELDAITKKFSVPNDPSVEVSFIANVERIEGLYVKSGIVSDNVMRSIIRAEKQQDKIYKVASGDTIDKVAETAGISKEALFAANLGLNEHSTIYSEQTLSLSNQVLYLDVKTTHREVYNEDIQFNVNTTEDNSLLEGTVKITRAGEIGVNKLTADVDKINGQVTDKRILNIVTLKVPVDENKIVGTMSPEELAEKATGVAPSSDRGTFIWPCKGGYTSQGSRSGHVAQDITGMPYGTPTHAAASGTVVISGWYYDYGNTVIIDHGNGFRTLYAHHSKLHVSVGQTVNQGDIIGGIGSTGRSTGNHLHFEIIFNGRQLNPAVYIGTRGR